MALFSSKLKINDIFKKITMNLGNQNTCKNILYICQRGCWSVLTAFLRGSCLRSHGLQPSSSPGRPVPVVCRRSMRSATWAAWQGRGRLLSLGQSQFHCSKSFRKHLALLMASVRFCHVRFSLDPGGTTPIVNEMSQVRSHYVLHWTLSSSGGRLVCSVSTVASQGMDQIHYGIE